MELLPLIRQHLYLEDDTIIPGLGGFTSRHYPARLVQETGTVMPPVREILFDVALQHNDGKLQQRVARECGTNLSRARQLLDDFVGELRHRTMAGEKIVLEGIGYFYADEVGGVLFRLEPGANLNLDSYGLPPVHVHQLVPRSPVRLSVPGPAGRISRSQAMEEPLHKQPVLHEGRPLRRVLIAVPLLFLLALLPNNPELTRRVSHEKAALGPDPSLFILEYPEAQIRESSREIVYPIGELEPAVEEGVEIVETPAPVAVQTARYPLVAGLFRSETNASRYAEELTGKGYPAAITVTPSGFHRITIGSFETLGEAQQRVNQIYREDPSIKPWILR
ncbi:MAG: SPOR domain-containing protein [Bacteroidales bacterium]